MYWLITYRDFKGAKQRRSWKGSLGYAMQKCKDRDDCSILLEWAPISERSHNLLKAQTKQTTERPIYNMMRKEVV